MKTHLHKYIITKILLFNLIFSATAENKLKSPAISSSEKTSFKEVSVNLSQGGIFYSYQGTNEFVRQYNDTFACLEKLSNSVVDDEKKRVQIQNLIKTVNQWIIKSGVTEVSGIGMSSIALEKDFYHNRTFIHHFPENQNGILWQIFAEKQDALECIKYIPENAVIAGAFDLRLEHVRSEFEKETEKVISNIKEIFKKTEKEEEDEEDDEDESLNPLTSLIPNPLSTIDETVPDVEKFEFKKFLASLDERAYFFITLDEKKPKDVVIAEHAFKVPDPSMLLILRVKNKDAFNELEKNLTNAIRTEENGTLKLTFEHPKSPLTYNPVIEQKGNLLLIASNPAIIKEFEELRSGKGKNLADSDVIRKLSRNIPDKACSFFYMSPELMPMLHRKFKEYIEILMKPKDGELKSKKSEHFVEAGFELANIHTPLREKSFIFSTVEQKTDGLMFYSNSAKPISGGADFFDICSVGPGLTSLSVGREIFDSSVSEEDELEERSCRGNFRKIKKAMDRYAVDHDGKYPEQSGVLGFGELITEKYLVDLRAIQCPDKVDPGKPIQFPLEEKMCDYIYFGNLKDEYNRNLPLVFDKPDKNGHIRILFINGRISTFKKPAKNCSEVVKMLHQNFNYSEKIYKYLQKIATRYDRILYTSQNKKK